MIGWLTKLAPVPDHPMRDLKAAQRIVDELPKGDAYKCLLELSAWIESVVQASGYRLQTRAAIIKLLDESGYAIQRKLQQEYLAQNRQAKFREQAVWRALVTGDAVREISRLARELRVDLIVIGHTHHNSRLERWWKGSVGASLVEESPCSILVAVQQPA